MFLRPDEAREVRQRFGTPCYVYDRLTLENAARTALDFPHAYGLTLRYAMKANPNASVLRTFLDLGLHIDASSEPEVLRALRIGIPPQRVQLTSQMPARDLEGLLDRGVLFNACSLHQLERVAALAPGTEESSRVNPGRGSGSSNRTNTGGPASSFGIWHEHLERAIALAAAGRLRIGRLHTHIGSGSDPDVWTRVAHMSLEIAARLPDVTTLNLGGGFKVARMPDEIGTDLQQVGTHVRGEFEAFHARTGRALRLEIEPGTYLVANAGVVVATCVDVVDTGAEGYLFAKLDTGMTEVTRPAMYGAQHPIAVVASRGEPAGGDTGGGADVVADVVFVGPCCESGDILTPATGDPEALAPRRVDRPQIGDLVLVGGAGAYCAAMSTGNYNSYPLAPEVMREADGRLTLLRRRQTLDDVLATTLDA
jgi:diaminopimelate decarboxylase